MAEHVCRKVRFLQLLFGTPRRQSIHRLFSDVGGNRRAISVNRQQLDCAIVGKGGGHNHRDAAAVDRADGDHVLLILSNLYLRFWQTGSSLRPSPATAIITRLARLSVMNRRKSG